MCERPVLEDPGMLEIVPNRKTTQRYAKGLLNGVFWTLQFVQHKTQEMCTNLWRHDSLLDTGIGVEQKMRKKLQKSCATMNRSCSLLNICPLKMFFRMMISKIYNERYLASNLVK